MWYSCVLQTIIKPEGYLIRSNTRSVLFRLGKTVNHVHQTPTRTGWVNLAALHVSPGQVSLSAHPSRDMLLTSTEVEDNKR